jgi:hypothetical protein
MDNRTKTTILGGIFAVAVAVITTYKINYSHKSEGQVITGIVVESAHNTEVGQALVSIVGRSEQATTNDNGNFRIVMGDDSPEFVTLRVTRQGYKPLQQGCRVPSEGLTVQIKGQ